MVWAPETVHCIIHFGTRFGGGGGGGGDGDKCWRRRSVDKFCWIVVYFLVYEFMTNYVVCVFHFFSIKMLRKCNLMLEILYLKETSVALLSKGKNKH